MRSKGNIGYSIALCLLPKLEKHCALSNKDITGQPLLKQTLKNHIDTASTIAYLFHIQRHSQPWSESIVTRKIAL